MSHFSVLVVGDDHEAQLAPHNENLTTAPRREYLNEHEIERMAEYYHTHDIRRLAREMKGWNGCRGGVGGGKRLYRISTYNRDAKWDWYEVGGRWSGHLLLKDGTRADACRKSDVDVEAMMTARETDARERWAAYAKAIEGTPRHERWEPLHERGGTDDEYHDQPRVKALAEAGLTGFTFGSADDYPETEEELVTRFRAEALCTFALLMDGEWHERGSMGWFACVSDEKPDWPAEFARLWATIPDDAIVTVIDCHI